MRALTVGVTGGIGAGKNLALVAVRRAGGAIVDTDEIARDQAKPGGAAYAKIVKAFGKTILNADRTIDRKKLGEIVFKSAAKRSRLERITHPLILKETFRRLKAARQVVYAAVPLLFEAGLEKMFDVTMTIEAPEKLRRKRVAKRDALTQAQVGERLAAQLNEKERIARADLVLRNTGSRSGFSRDVRSYHRAFSLLRKGAGAR